MREAHIGNTHVLQLLLFLIQFGKAQSLRLQTEISQLISLCFLKKNEIRKTLLKYESLYFAVQFSSVQPLSRVWLFVTLWTAAHYASLFFTNSRSLFKLMSIQSVMPSNHLILIVPFSSHLQSFSASGSFPVIQFFTSGRVSTSTSVLPMNIQDWFPLGCTGWISLQSKGLSRVFSNITVQEHQFFVAQLTL